MQLRCSRRRHGEQCGGHLVAHPRGLACGVCGHEYGIPKERWFAGEAADTAEAGDEAGEPTGGIRGGSVRAEPNPS